MKPLTPIQEEVLRAIDFGFNSSIGFSNVIGVKVYNALQSLRKRGLIKFNAKTGWGRVK